jgi:hypothetical protein
MEDHDFYQEEEAQDFGQAPPPMDYAPEFFEGGMDHYENIGEVDYTDEYAPAVLDSPEDDEEDAEPDDVWGVAGDTLMDPNAAGDDIMILGAPPAGEPLLFGGGDPFVAMESQQQLLVQEPPQETPMAKWNREFQEILKERKDEENAAKAAHVEQARNDLEDFQALREKKKEARMAKNRSDEQQKLEDMEADLENDNSWQRVVKMVELQQDSVDGMRDSKSMIDVLIKMKNDPERAVALA